MLYHVQQSHRMSHNNNTCIAQPLRCAIARGICGASPLVVIACTQSVPAAPGFVGATRGCNNKLAHHSSNTTRVKQRITYSVTAESWSSSGNPIGFDRYTTLHTHTHAYCISLGLLTALAVSSPDALACPRRADASFRWRGTYAGVFESQCY